MPHIRVRGMTTAQVQALSENLGEELAPIIHTSPDNFTVEHIPSQFFANGRTDGGYPFIEVLWFDRPGEVKQKTAEHLTTRVKQLLPAADVAVIFRHIDKTDYFENGRHF